MKTFTVILALLMTVLIFQGAPGASAPEGEKLFREGNDAYKNGNYGKAMECYDRLIREKGHESPGLYYNMANACFKNEKPGLALYYYEKAHKMAPRDQDISFNLSFVRKKISPTGVMSVRESFQWLNNLCTLNELTVTASLFYFVFAVILILYVFGRQERLLWLLCTMGIIVIFTGIALSMAVYSQDMVRYGIIVAPSAEMRTGPNISENVSTIIPEGTKVRIMRSEEDWTEVRAYGKLNRDDLAPHQIQGWIPDKEMKRL